MGIKIEVFASPGCRRCDQAKAVLRELAEEVGHGRIDYREVDVVEELDYAVALGVLSTPVIAIDGRIRFTGLPSICKLRAELDRRLAAEKGARRT